MNTDDQSAATTSESEFCFIINNIQYYNSQNYNSIKTSYNVTLKHTRHRQNFITQGNQHCIEDVERDF